MTPSLHQACEAFKDCYRRALAEHPEDIRPVDELDVMIHQARMVIGAASMATTLLAAQDKSNAVCRCGGHGVIQRRPGAEVRSMQGQHRVQGVALRCANCGRTWRPVHEKLGIDGQYHTTVLLERLSSDFCLDKGSPSAARRLKEHHGLEVGRTTVLQHAEQRGVEAREFVQRKLQQALEQSESQRGKPLRVAEVFVQMDSSSGKTVKPLARPTLVNETVERTPIRGLVKAKRPVEGRQVKLLCAQAKGEASWAYHGYIGEFDEAVVPLQGLAATRGWQDGTLVVMTSDGEPSIQEVGQGAFDPHFQFILDHPHAMTHLGDVSQHAPERLVPLPKDEWLKYATARLHQGEALKLVHEIRDIARRLPKGEDRTKVENAALYFEKRASATHYDAFKERNWPIASGNVEGGHRAFVHPVSKRGAGWLLHNLNGLVALACVRQSEWWEEFWDFVKDRRRAHNAAPDPLEKAA